MTSKRIALTGGIASGKSTVAAMLEQRGAIILDADRVARTVVQPGSSTWQALRDFLGPDYFGADGSIKRHKLRKRIAEDSEIRVRLNSVLHPAIRQTMEEQWREYQEKEPHRIVIFDIPLLYEANMAHRFHPIILVYVPREIQIQRLMSRDGFSRKEAEKMLQMQLPIESKKELAHLIIDNSRDLEYTREQVEDVWEKLKVLNTC